MLYNVWCLCRRRRLRRESTSVRTFFFFSLTCFYILCFGLYCCCCFFELFKQHIARRALTSILISLYDAAAAAAVNVVLDAASMWLAAGCGESWPHSLESLRYLGNASLLLFLLQVSYSSSNFCFLYRANTDKNDVDQVDATTTKKTLFFFIRATCTTFTLLRRCMTTMSGRWQGGQRRRLEWAKILYDE